MTGRRRSNRGSNGCTSILDGKATYLDGTTVNNWRCKLKFKNAVGNCYIGNSRSTDYYGYCLTVLSKV